MSLTLRNAARALILDEDERVLLCRLVSPTQPSRTERGPSGLLQAAA